MENDKIKNIKECVLKEAENVVAEYINKEELAYSHPKKEDDLSQKLKKQRLISFFFFVLLIIILIVK